MEALRNTVKQSQFNLATAFAKRAIQERSLEGVMSTMCWLSEMYGANEASLWTVDHLMPQIDQAEQEWLAESFKQRSDRQ